MSQFTYRMANLVASGLTLYSARGRPQEASETYGRFLTSNHVLAYREQQRHLGDVVTITACHIVGAPDFHAVEEAIQAQAICSAKPRIGCQEGGTHHESAIQ